MRGTVALLRGRNVIEALDLLAARERSWADIAPVVLPLVGLVDEGLVPLGAGRAAQIKTALRSRCRRVTAGGPYRPTREGKR